MLTPRENFLRFFRHEPYEWTPSTGDLKKFLPALYPDNVARGRVVQQLPFPEERYGGKDFFGVNWVFEQAVGGSMETEPLFADPEDLENWEELMVFPDLDSLPWEQCAEENREFLQTDGVIAATLYSGYFERLISLVGFENAAIALIDEEQQDWVHGLFQKLTDFYIGFIQRLHRYFNVEWVEVHDDWGTQKSLMFSTDTHSEMILPYMKKLVEGAHACGVLVEQHSCGKIESLVPNIIASGVDTWCGQSINDKAALVNEYGDRFRFGVGIMAGEPMEDGEALKLVEQCRREYQGKDVWFSFLGKFTPGQHRLMREYLAAEGR